MHEFIQSYFRTLGKIGAVIGITILLLFFVLVVVIVGGSIATNIIENA